jgi:hypothetical protein
MKLSQAAAALFASAVAVGAFTPSAMPLSRNIGASAQPRLFVPKFTSSLAMSDSAVVDAETVEEGETFE